jgi:hypothetical protein
MQKNVDGSNGTNTPLYTSINNFFNYLIDTIYYIKNYRCTGQCRIFPKKLLCVIKIISVYFIMKKIIDAQDSAEFFSKKIYQCRIIFKKTTVRIFLLCVYFFLICGLSKRYCAICHTLVVS